MLRDWNYEKKAFFTENPELDNKYFKRHMDSIAAELANDEIAEFRRIVSSPEEIAKKAGKELRVMLAQAEAIALKKTTTQREKVTKQGIPESKHTKAAKTEEEALDEASGLKYAQKFRTSRHAEHQRRIRGLA
jgi:hypothetical protein